MTMVLHLYTFGLTRGLAMRKKKSAVQKFLRLTDKQKVAEVAQLDKPLPLDSDGLPGRPLSPAKREQWKRIQRRLRRGRPTIGKGAKRVPVSIEQGLLEEADAYARRHNLKRSQMVAQGLRLVMAQ